MAEVNSMEDALLKRRMTKRALPVVVLLITIACALSFVGCSSLEEAISEAQKAVPKDWKLLYTEMADDHTAIVFYTRKEDLGAGLIRKDKLGWNWIGSTLGPLISEPEGLAWRHADLSNKGPLYIYYGLVKNAKIAEVQVIGDKDQVLKAKIIDADGARIWYAIAKGPIASKVSIQGLSQEGKVIYYFEQAKS